MNRINFYLLNDALTNEVSARAELGAHNLLPFDMSIIKAKNTSGTWSNNVYSSTSGLTCTFNSDGSVKINGTPSSTTMLFLIDATSQSDYFLIPDKEYIVSGHPSGHTTSTRVQVEMNGITTGTSTSNDGKFTAQSWSTRFSVLLRINSGDSFSNETFYPMLRLATDTDPTYQSYAKTNRELTEVKKTTRSDSTHLTADITIKECGNVVTVNYNGDLKSISATTWTDLVELPSTAWPDEMIGCEVFNNTSAKIVIRINTNGKLAVYNYGSAITSAVNGKFMLTYIK